MSPVPWPSSFDAVLRSYLGLKEDEEINPELNLVDQGLDSMATVSLLLDLEEQYAVTIPDEQLATLASADVAALWALLEEAGAEASRVSG